MNLVLFCTSPGHVAATLRLLRQEPASTTSVLVVTYVASVRDFLVGKFPDRLVRVLYIRPDELRGLAFRNPLFSASRWFYKYYLFFKYFAHIKSARVYFFSGYVVYTAFFAKMLSRRNEVFFMELDQWDWTDMKGAAGFREKLIAFIYRLLYGIPYRIVALRGQYLLLLESGRFTEAHGIRLRPQEIATSDEGSSLVARHKKVLVLTADASTRVRNQDRTWGAVMEIVRSQYGPEEVVLKEHPRLPFDGAGLFNGLDRLSPDIPAELLLDHPFDLIVGYPSSTLVHAARYYSAPGCALLRPPIVVCLIDLFEFLSEHDRVIMRSAGFGQWEGRSLQLPGSYDELRAAVVGAKSRGAS